MCGRYYVDDETAREIERIIQMVDRKIKFNNRDICPTQPAPVLYKNHDKLELTEMKWGFPNNIGKGVLFNARSESIEEKPTFKESVNQRRCVIPAAGFYEWDKSRNKVTFERSDSRILYLAGIWKADQEQNCFVVLTAPANASVKEVHDRMPLILEPGEIENWIFDAMFLSFLLKKTLPQLKTGREYEQLSFGL